MKKFNVVFGLTILAFAGFSFIGYNNFTGEIAVSEEPKIRVAGTFLEGADYMPTSDTISKEEFIEYVDKELIEPIRKCMEAHDPDVFMTKCYTNIYFQLDLIYPNEPIYKGSNISGIIKLRNCSQKAMHMAEVSVNYEQKTIKVRESFYSPTLEKDAYISSICKYIKKDGLPKADF